jgi:hypothetical protein
MRFLQTVFAALAIMASVAGVQADDTHSQTLRFDCFFGCEDHDKAKDPHSAIRKENIQVSGTLAYFDVTTRLLAGNGFVAIYAEQKSDEALVNSNFYIYGANTPLPPTVLDIGGPLVDQLAFQPLIASTSSLSFTTPFSGHISSVISATPDNGAGLQAGNAPWHYDSATGTYWPAPGLTLASTSPYAWLAILIPDTLAGVLNMFAVSTQNNNPTTGDPQFNGMQGQSYQFHGMADEVFSLISSPDLQMNSLFKFISSGTCNYNETVCWSHPGTYLGQIGLQYGADTKISFQSGAHADGMRVFVNEKEITPGKHIHRFTARNSSQAIMQYRSKTAVEIDTDSMFIRVVNSDYFFNIDFGMKNSQILTAGNRPLHITGEVCEIESRTPRAQLQGADTKAIITKKLKETYPAYPLHGLIGQTWRNAVYCGRYYEGTVDDYVTGGLFSNEHTFNYFNQA